MTEFSQYGGMPAFLVGVIAATASVGACVLFAFWDATVRFAHAQFRGELSAPDRLAAGIWICALGTSIAGGALVYREIVAPAPIVVNLLAWSLIGVGYFYHFTAWRAVAHGKAYGFSVAWAMCLVLIGVTAAFVATSIRWPHFWLQ